MTTDPNAETIIKDDPILGQFIATYPVNRLRLLILGGLVLGVVWFVTTVTLWNVDQDIASIATVTIIFVVSLVVGWGIMHLWNREVVLYERGFSYRRGSQQAYIHYKEVQTVRQKGEVISYFGGLVRRSTLVFTIITDAEEVISLTALYLRVDELTFRLESAIIRVRLPIVQKTLAAGETVAFGERLALHQDGIKADGQTLPWADFGGYKAAEHQLMLLTTADAVWFKQLLVEIDNLRLLVELLRSYQG